MGCEQEIAQILKESGHRLTPQRMMILATVRHAKGHIAAAEILNQVKESYPYIDVSTVYRNLGVLKEMGMVTETDMGGGEFRYEWVNQDGHHHLVCRKCGKVTLLDNECINSLGGQILDEYAFEAEIKHFAIFGICSGCRQDAKNPDLGYIDNAVVAAPDSAS